MHFYYYYFTMLRITYLILPCHYLFRVGVLNM
jgi:hypothetical protein